MNIQIYKYRRIWGEMAERVFHAHGTHALFRLGHEGIAQLVDGLVCHSRLDPRPRSDSDGGSELHCVKQ